MNTNLLRRISSLSLISILLFLFLSCKKNVDTIADAGNVLPDLVTKVTSSVSGFVTDQNNAAVTGAIVKAGTSTTLTNRYGYFEFKNIQVVKEAATVEVSYAGYFKGIKTYMATEGKAAFFRIKLLQKTIAGTINATSGGAVSLSNGLNISLPANAVKNSTTGLAYTGTVNIAAQFIDPTSNEIIKTMPGDLRGIDAGGFIKGLTSYGMMAVELTGASGELLQIAGGKKATITFPVPASINATAPAIIPLWYFDESNGLWKEEGAATKTGNNYVGDVSHFSFWNFDSPASYAHFNINLVTDNNIPLSYVAVKISHATFGENFRMGYADSTGYISGAVPLNKDLKLEIFASGCDIPVYSTNFSVTNDDPAVKTITIPNTALLISTISGTVHNCNDLPVSNGFIMMFGGNQYMRIPIKNDGTYSFSSILCNSVSTETFIATDQNSSTENNPVTYDLVPGVNTLPVIKACQASTVEFIDYSINGAHYHYEAPATTFNYQPYSSVTTIIANVQPVNTSFWISNGVPFAAGVDTPLGVFGEAVYSDPGGMISVSLANPIMVHITEFGPVGQFISGNFSGTMVRQMPPLTQYNIQCNFRVRRLL